SFEQRMEDLAIHGTDDTGVNSDVGRGQVAAHWSASAAILKLHVDQQHVANLVRSGPGHRGTPIVEALRTTGRQPDRLTGHANPYQRPAVDEDDGTDYGPQPPGGAEMPPGQLNDGERCEGQYRCNGQKHKQRGCNRSLLNCHDMIVSNHARASTTCSIERDVSRRRVRPSMEHLRR